MPHNKNSYLNIDEELENKLKYFNMYEGYKRAELASLAVDLSIENEKLKNYNHKINDIIALYLKSEHEDGHEYVKHNKDS